MKDIIVVVLNHPDWSPPIIKALAEVCKIRHAPPSVRKRWRCRDLIAQGIIHSNSITRLTVCSIKFFFVKDYCAELQCDMLQISDYEIVY